MKKKISTIMLALIMLLTSIIITPSVNVSAQDLTNSTEEEIILYLDFTRIASSTCSISNGQATATARLIGYPGITTKISIEMTLQKENLWGLWWSDETSWSATYYTDEALMSRHHKVSGGTYRIKTVFTVYSGSKSETIEKYSTNVSC